MFSFLPLLLALLISARIASADGEGRERKVFGVNLGGWLVLEPWMAPSEWLQMGGQQCDDCSTCIASEFAFARAYPDTVDATFAKHWTSWFTKSDAERLKALGINTVRVPLGYWIIEPLVDRKTEFYPRGGLQHLVEGLGWLKESGIQVILDHHALPGVQTPNQQFTGRCTTDVEFYTPFNYHRALVWTAVMTALSHLHENFETVFAIEAVNEPIMDASQTPGYGSFQPAFVQTVRLMEFMLGVQLPPSDWAKMSCSPSTLNNFRAGMNESIFGNASTTFFAAFDASGGGCQIFSTNAALAVSDALPIILQVASQIGMNEPNTWSELKSTGHPLTTNFMDINWQNNDPPNPADAAIGPQAYDNHLYYSFGGVADPNPDAYLSSICNLQRVQADAALGNSPLWFGEWALSTNFNATPDFMRDWADAQKMAYSTGAGWIFWNFKIEDSNATVGVVEQWSYFKGIELGWLTEDPSQYHNSSVCSPYRKPQRRHLRRFWRR